MSTKPYIDSDCPDSRLYAMRALLNPPPRVPLYERIVTFVLRLFPVVRIG